MTIRTGTDAYGHHALNMRAARTPAAVYRTGRGQRQGIARLPDRPRAAKDRPLSARHAAILERVGTEPTPPRAIADALGLPTTGVISSLYSLSARELVARIPDRGWVRT